MDQETAVRKLPDATPGVMEVIRAAKELEELLRQRAEITQRILLAKQTITGLVGLFGGRLSEEDNSLLARPRSKFRQAGFTQACREVLAGAERPLNGREFQEQLRLLYPRAAVHKDLSASVTTVLNRLVAYGEARVIEDSAGCRAWVRTDRRASVPAVQTGLADTPMEIGAA